MATERQREARKQARQVRNHYLQQLREAAQARAAEEERVREVVCQRERWRASNQRSGPRGHLLFVSLLLGLAS